jgi:hypothetical protein
MGRNNIVYKHPAPPSRSRQLQDEGTVVHAGPVVCVLNVHCELSAASEELAPLAVGEDDNEDEGGDGGDEEEAPEEPSGYGIGLDIFGAKRNIFPFLFPLFLFINLPMFSFFNPII